MTDTNNPNLQSRAFDSGNFDKYSNEFTLLKLRETYRNLIKEILSLLETYPALKIPSTKSNLIDLTNLTLERESLETINRFLELFEANEVLDYKTHLVETQMDAVIEAEEKFIVSYEECRNPELSEVERNASISNLDKLKPTIRNIQRFLFSAVYPSNFAEELEIGPARKILRYLGTLWRLANILDLNSIKELENLCLFFNNCSNNEEKWKVLVNNLAASSEALSLTQSSSNRSAALFSKIFL